QALSEEEQLALPLALGVQSPKPQVQSSKRSTGRGQEALAGEEGRATDSFNEPRATYYGSRITDQGSRTTNRESQTTPHSLFITFASTCTQICSTSKKLEKTRWLAAYLKSLATSEVGFVTPWFTGSPFPSTQNKVLQLGWAVIRDALCAVGELDHAGFGQVYLKHSDLGETALEILQR